MWEFCFSMSEDNETSKDSWKIESIMEIWLLEQHQQIYRTVHPQ